MEMGKESNWKGCNWMGKAIDSRPKSEKGETIINLT